MPRGRQYYDPIIQAPSRVETQGQKRIELYPEHDIRDNVESPRWVARLIGEDGLIVQHSPGSFDHDDALRQALEMWPGLEVFELREESEDSTHEGMGPSPRLWQNAQGVAISEASVPPAVEAIQNITRQAFKEDPKATMAEVSRMLVSVTAASQREGWEGSDADYFAPQLHAIQVGAPGIYLQLEDVLSLLENYAAQFDGENNPSAALGLREAASALREAF